MESFSTNQDLVVSSAPAFKERSASQESRNSPIAGIGLSVHHLLGDEVVFIQLVKLEEEFGLPVEARTDTPPPQAIRVGAAATPAPAAKIAVESSMAAEHVSTSSGGPVSGADGVGAVEGAAVCLAKAGLAFLQSIATELKNCPPAPGQQSHAAVSSLFSRHPRTNHPMLAIPLPQSFTAERITRAVALFLSALEAPAQ